MQRKGKKEIGYGKPPEGRPFAPGQSGNPGGKTSAQKKLEMENATLAQQAKNRFLRALVALQAEQSTEEVLAGMTGADLLRLIKDAEDRAHGTPKQAVDVTSSDGSMTPKGVPDDVRAALDAIAGKIAGGNKPGKVASDGET
jgi:hypothetical protein